MEKLLSNIADNIKRIQSDIIEEALKCGRDPNEIRLMAVTKTVPAPLVNHAVSCGIRLLGENRAQELRDKYEEYNKDGVDIHFIGHLQTNKVKYIVDKVSMVHSVGSLKLAQEISRQCVKAGVSMDLLAEVNIGGEASKSGIPSQEVEGLLSEIAGLDAIKVRGLMTIPPICANRVEIERYFSKMQAIMVDIKAKKIDNITMDFLSMGMSDDYRYAIPYGANILRVGSAIFGSRG